MPLRGIASQLFYRFRPCWEHHRFLLETERWPVERLHDLQLAKLRQVVERALDDSEFIRGRYRDQGARGPSLRRLEDIQALPVLDRDDLAELVERDRLDTRRLVQLRTGGTSGAPVTTYAARSHLDWARATILRFHHWIGYGLGERQSRLFAAPTRTGFPETGWRVRARNWLANAQFLDALDLSEQGIDSIVWELRGFQPKLLMGYTSCLAAVAEWLRRRSESLGVPDLRIVNAAEPLDPLRRQLIEEALGAPMFDHYGTREVGSIADECLERNGLHIHMEHVLVEVVSEQGNWVEPGVEGEVLVTQLNNPGMPLIRYRIGDRAMLAEEDCPCGRSLLRLARVTGRLTDFILLPDGTRLTGLVFPHILKDFPVAEYQIRQVTLREVEVQLLLREADPGVLERIRHSLASRMPGIDLRVEAVKSIPRTASGKLRSVVSMVH